MSRFYRFYHYLAKVLFWIFTKRIIVRGVENIPAAGPAILISNHLSYSDPASIIGFIDRQVYFMTKSEMFNGGFMDWVITKAAAFPVRRGTVDREAVRHALGILKRGDLLGIYPEGTRSANHHVQEARAGVVLMAKQSGAPIIPIAITGMEHVFRRGFPWVGRPVVTMTVGKPFGLSDITSEPITAANRAYVTERVMARIVELLPTQYGGQAQPVLGHL
jgi:1-acyl-sn-glycerol-3-phosphate acyltransferase